jgi:glycosyltransferase involved in cell wall biosynthesis
MFLSIIICTYNPDIKRLNQTLDGIKNQSLPYDHWELIVVDNNSSISFTNKIDISWHINSKIVVERRQGLTYARLKGFIESTGDLILLVDDDNILNANYLAKVAEIFSEYPTMGAIGGKSIPLFEDEPPNWLREFHSNLALRDLGEEISIEKWENKYPETAPIGAGMGIRKKALKSYIDRITVGSSAISDRKGTSLSSGGDNEINIEILKAGWLTGYFPQLIIHHIIPKERMQVNYLAHLTRSTNCSWIQLLESHGLNPWAKIARWTVPFRKFKAWFTYKAWKNKVNYIKWQAACGNFNGLSKIL